ncbi:MAG TPA: hypothetical protein VGH56_03180 [Solirubrobacteraceae bacterium]|jgi:hypothetical protein
MKAWMLPWLFPLWMVAAVTQPPDGAWRDPEANYWQIKHWL